MAIPVALCLRNSGSQTPDCWLKLDRNTQLNREIKRRTRAIGAFHDGQSALMLVCARLRHVAGTQWGAKRYMNMDHLAELDIQNEADNIAG